MSKLDEIYFDIHYAKPPHDKLFMININNDLVYQAFKDELKCFLFDEVIGHDEPEIVAGDTALTNIGRNELRAEIRARVEEL